MTQGQVVGKVSTRIHGNKRYALCLPVARNGAPGMTHTENTASNRTGNKLRHHSVLPQLQRRQSEEDKHRCDNPKTDNHARLRPTGEFKVMMNGCHFEDTLAA